MKTSPATREDESRTASRIAIHADCFLAGQLYECSALRYTVSHQEANVATTEMVHVRVDKRVKARAAKALATMGLSVSDAVRVLLTRVAVEKALPFEVKAPNAVTAAAMQEARKGGLRSFQSVSGLMADLNAED